MRTRIRSVLLFPFIACADIQIKAQAMCFHGFGAIYGAIPLTHPCSACNVSRTNLREPRL